MQTAAMRTDPPSGFEQVRQLGLAIRAGADRRASTLLHQLATRRNGLVNLWCISGLLLVAIKLAVSPHAGGGILELAVMGLPSLVVLAAPVLAIWIAERTPPMPARTGPVQRASVPKILWRRATARERLMHRLRGPGYLIASLAIGTMLNVPVRLLEYLAIVPAIRPADPAWVHALVQMFTLDAAVLSFFYTYCFMLVLRSAPIFPRTLAIVWCLDALFQLAIASVLGGRADIPVDVRAALGELLVNNLHKTAISAVVWTPFLIVSPRINLLCRNRVRMRLS